MKKIGEILGNSEECQKSKETEDLSPKKEVIKKAKVDKTKVEKAKAEPKSNGARLNPSVPSVPTVFDKWIAYCDKNRIGYTQNNIRYWEKKLDKRVSIEQEKAIYTAINRKWKDFYVVPIKESKYHQFLGKSLMMERDCDTLLDIGYKNAKYIYQFKNIKISTTAPPSKLFKKYGYLKSEVKTALGFAV